MNAPKNGKKNGAELWKAIKQSEIDDDVEAILAMSDAELDADIRASGGDPAAIRARGAASAKELSERHEQNAWHGEMGAKLGAFRETAAATRTKTPLPRPELLRRLETARNDPRFAVPVAALFQTKTLEASTDAELQALLDQIALLGTLSGS